VTGGEFEAIERIRRRLCGPPVGVIWIGDDTAVLPPVTGRLLLAADAVVAGVHADLALSGLDDFGWKALVANVSDIAAMGGEPGHAVVTVAGPADTDLDLLYRGLAEASATFDVPIVGGDLTNAPVLVVTVAITGSVEGDPVLRSGAHPRDVVWVTGPLGASAHALAELRAGTGRGDAHRRPRARVAEGRAARVTGATAMIDVSDGLSADLGHILDASGVGVRLDEVPVAAGATIDDALGGGEDYELVFTAPPATDVPGAFAAAGLGPPVRIGACVEDTAERTLRGAPLPRPGWEHRWVPRL
jgi:thiamine-monophosphate kinase